MRPLIGQGASDIGIETLNAMREAMANQKIERAIGHRGLGILPLSR